MAKKQTAFRKRQYSGPKEWPLNVSTCLIVFRSILSLRCESGKGTS